MDLLEEEMRRIVQFLMWRSDWWRQQIGRKGLVDGAQLEGETAYALRQSAFQTALASSFTAKWVHLPDLIKAGRLRTPSEASAPVGVTPGGSAGGPAMRREESDNSEASESESEEDSEAEETSSGEDGEGEPIGVIGALPLRPVKAAYTDS